MARRNVYIVRIATACSMADIVTHLGDKGVVEAINVAKNKAMSSEEASRVAKVRDKAHPDVVATRVANLQARMAEWKGKLIDTLVGVLQANQHAPMEVIVREMNKTGVKTYRNTDWTVANLSEHVETALLKMTTPEGQA